MQFYLQPQGNLLVLDRHHKWEKNSLAGLTASSRALTGNLLMWADARPTSESEESMSESNLKCLFSSLKSQANQLNSAAESTNEALELSQEQLRALHIGIEIWFSKPLERSDTTGGIQPHDISTEYLTILGFAKIAGKWCLASKKIRQDSGFYEGDIGCPYTNEYLETSPEPLLNQTRHLRLNALKALPDFLAEISEKIDNLLSDLPKAHVELQ